ncbi:MAG TPA: MarR family transcriptional regulator [Polyangiaceae bacterium]|nr:MarR family transcriptional regulator [Polyangiaceae bacterium]
MARDTERTRLLEAIADEGRRTGTRSVLLHAAVAEKLGLNQSDHKCSDLIAAQPHPITAGRLAELTGLSTGAITGVLDRLEAAGFIARDHDPNDRRRVVIRATPERAPDLSAVFKPLREAMIAYCDRYTNQQLQVILEFMRGSEQVLHEQMSRLQKLGPLPRGNGSSECGLPGKMRTALMRAARSGLGRAVTQVAAEVAVGVAAEMVAEAGARSAAKAHATDRHRPADGTRTSRDGAASGRPRAKRRGGPV